ncbi:MAG: beta-N-acetylhexosaminidase [Anaerolineae bacterium]|nr:beta-N-acetylhexosaminidase [Anaerolineae bacterium]
MMTLEEKIGQMCFVGFEGFEPPDYILEWLANGRIGGVILFARNISTPAQVAALTQACHAAARRPILIAIDQEGGIVARLRDGFTESPGAMVLGAADSEALAEQVSTILAKEMRALGINWNLAPVLDITHDIHNPSMSVRSLGIDPARIAALGVAQVRGFQQAGVAATGKHFPGRTKTPVDPHLSLPVIVGSLDEMRQTDLVPYRAVIEAGISAIMISHVQFKDLDPTYPSTLSPAIITGLLREELGFTGLISTDCMEMGAITNTYGPGESAVLAALAGANVIFFSHTRDYQEAAYEALLSAVQAGRLPIKQVEAAVQTIEAVKQQFAITSMPNLAVMRQPDHLDPMIAAARQGTVIVRADDAILPLKADDQRRIGVVEFASYFDSEVLGQGGQTGLIQYLKTHITALASVAIPSGQLEAAVLDRARDLAQNCDLLIVATRNAHLIPAQRDFAQELLNDAPTTVLVCLRNPYDAGVLNGSNAVICSLGDSPPSLRAVGETLTGHYVPSGVLPVPV